MPYPIRRGAWAPAIAVVTLLAWQPALFAQLSKVDCKDKECDSWWQKVCLFCSQHKPCPHCGAGSKHCSPFKQEYYGYHPPQWRSWPGVQPNYTPTPRTLQGLGLDTTLPSPTPMMGPPKPSKPPQSAVPAAPSGVQTARQLRSGVEVSNGSVGVLPPPAELRAPTIPMIRNGPPEAIPNPAARLVPPGDLSLPPAPPVGGKS